MQKQGQPHFQIVAEPEQFESELRTIAYAILNSFVLQHAIISETLGMKPAKLIVYLCIVVSTVQRVMRQTDLPAELRAGSKIPAQELGGISRRGIAAATGLPNENVRRIVNDLIAEGLVMPASGGGLRNVGGNFRNPKIIAALKQLFAENVRTQQQLLNVGAVSIEA